MLMLLPQDGVSESQDQGGGCQGNRSNSVLHRGDRADVLQGRRLESSTSSIATTVTVAACYELHLKYLVDGVSCASRRLFLFVFVVPSAIQTRREVPGSLLLHCTDVFPQFPSDRRHELGHGEGPLRLAFEEEAGDRYCDLFGKKHFAQISYFLFFLPSFVECLVSLGFDSSISFDLVID